MSEVLRDLVVSLSLDGDNFSRNLTSINKQIQEAESEFKRAAAGVKDFEKSASGARAELDTLGQKFTLQQKAVTQYERALEAANKKLETAHAKQGKLTASLAEASTRNADLKTKVAAATKQYEAFQRELGDADSATIAAKANLDALSQEYTESAAEVKKLEGQLAANTKSLQNNADAVTKARTNLNQAQAALKQTEAQIKATTDKLARLRSAWTKTGETLTVLAAQRIGDDLNPTVQKLIDGANGLLEKFMALDEKQRLMIIKFAAIAAAAGPAILAFSKVVKVVGIVSTGFGKFALSVGKAGGGWKGFISVLGKSPAVWLAVGAAVVVATKALYDYATGATEARKALEGMNQTADKWASHAAESIYNNEGLASFGLSKDDFKGAFALKSASAWKDGLIRVWTDGKKETKEIVTEWTDSFKALNVGMTESLQKLKSDATATGHSEVADTIQKDIDALAAMDTEVERLLKKRQNGLLSAKDKLRLDELIDAREAIQKRGQIMVYLEALKAQGLVRSFDEALWYGTVEQVRIGRDGKMKFIFKDGTVIED